MLETERNRNLGKISPVTILALFIIMLTDPIRLCIAFSFAFAGFKSKRLSPGQWIALATVAATFVVETALHLTQSERQIFPALIAALAASLFHVLIATWILRQFTKWRKQRGH